MHVAVVTATALDERVIYATCTCKLRSHGFRLWSAVRLATTSFSLPQLSQAGTPCLDRNLCMLQVS